MKKINFIAMSYMFVSLCAADTPKPLFDAVKYQEVGKQPEATFDEQAKKSYEILNCFSSYADIKLRVFRYGVAGVVAFQKENPKHSSNLKMISDLLEKIKNLAQKQVEK